jgi:hypothetical protein
LAFRRRSDLILDNLALRQQLAVFKHQRPSPRLTGPGRLPALQTHDHAH